MALEATQRSLQAELARREEENRALSLRLTVLEASLSRPSTVTESYSSAASSGHAFDGSSSEEHSLISRPAMSAVLVETEAEEPMGPGREEGDAPVSNVFLGESPPRPTTRWSFPRWTFPGALLRRTAQFAVASLKALVNAICTTFVRGSHILKDNFQRMSVLSVSYVAWVVSVFIVKSKFEEEDSHTEEDPPQKTNPTDTLSRQLP